MLKICQMIWPSLLCVRFYLAESEIFAGSCFKLSSCHGRHSILEMMNMQTSIVFTQKIWQPETDETDNQDRFELMYHEIQFDTGGSIIALSIAENLAAAIGGITSLGPKIGVNGF